MTKSDLIARLAAETQLSKADVGKVLDALTDAAMQELAQDQAFTFPGIVKLTPKAREARTGRNPRTGEAITIPAKTTISAKVSATLIKAIQ